MCATIPRGLSGMSLISYIENALYPTLSLKFGERAGNKEL
jgi:hypothetical protein